MSELESWHTHAVRVRFQDIDAAGIAFFATAFELFHDAYVEGLRAHGVELARVLDEGRWGAPITHAEAKFRRPMRFGDALLVEVNGALSERDLTVRYRVRSASDPSIEQVVGSTTHAFIDRASFARCAIPPEITRAFGRDAQGA
jgi:YbgC/YbaW family acyl-CoA thioester hydrolase